MKFCQMHWDELKRLVTESGMGGLIEMRWQTNPEPPAIKHCRVQGIPEHLHIQEVEGTQISYMQIGDPPAAGEVRQWDPLVCAYTSLAVQSIKQGGLYLIGKNSADASGHYCPMCEVEAGVLEQFHEAGGALDWMTGCVAEVFSYATQNNLLQPKQLH